MSAEADRDAAVRERDQAREALRQIEQYRYSLNETLDAIVAMKEIARAALTGEGTG